MKKEAIKKRTSNFEPIPFKSPLSVEVKKNTSNKMLKIESFLDNYISSKFNILNMQTIVGDEDYERIFVLTAEEELSAKELSDLLTKVNRELYNYCNSNNLLDDYTETLVSINR